MTGSLGSLVVVAVLAVLVVVGLLIVVLLRLRHPVPADWALLVGRIGGAPRVIVSGPASTFGLGPVERVSLATIAVPVTLCGREAPRCADRLRVDVTITFSVRVNRTVEDVLLVARTMGSERASSPELVAEHHRGRFAAAVHDVLARVSSEELLGRREAVRDEIIQVIGMDLNGFVLEDAAIVQASLTPIEQLDPHNPEDAEAIARITERTAAANGRAHDVKRAERLAAAKQNVEAEEAMAVLERQRAEAEARRDREIAVVTERERAEVERVRLAELAKTHELRIALVEQLAAKGVPPESIRREWESLIDEWREELVRVRECRSEQATATDATSEVRA